MYTKKPFSHVTPEAAHFYYQDFDKICQFLLFNERVI